MARGQISMKRLGVDKTNARIVGVTAAAAFLVVFFLVASFSLFSQLTYQNRVIKAKKQAVSQLRKNLTARDSLVDSYKTFADSQQNILGGTSTGNGPHDGNNPKRVLDALPSKYDFPALATSVEKLGRERGLFVDSITGVDDEVNQVNQASNDPKPVEIPYEVKVTGDYLGVKNFVEALDHSIRPMQIQMMQISGDQKALSIDVSAKTFYQPDKTLNLRSKVVK